MSFRPQFFFSFLLSIPLKPVQYFSFFLLLLLLLRFITTAFLEGRAGVGGQGTGKGHDGRAKVLQPHFRGACAPGEIDSVLEEISFAVELTKSYQKQIYLGTKLTGAGVVGRAEAASLWGQLSSAAISPEGSAP